MTPDEAQRTLDRYRSSVAYPVAGQPFGWGIVQFKDRMRRRLIERGYDPQRAWWRAERAYERIMRYSPSFADYCEAQRVLRSTLAPSPSLTREEWQHLADVFDGANDPLSASIGDKARRMIDP